MHFEESATVLRKTQKPFFFFVLNAYFLFVCLLDVFTWYVNFFTDMQTIFHNLSVFCWKCNVSASKFVFIYLFFSWALHLDVQCIWTNIPEAKIWATESDYVKDNWDCTQSLHAFMPVFMAFPQWALVYSSILQAWRATIVLSLGCTVTKPYLFPNPQGSNWTFWVTAVS